MKQANEIGVFSLSYGYLCLNEPWTSLQVFSLPGGTSPEMGQRLYKSPGILNSSQLSSRAPALVLRWDSACTNSGYPQLFPTILPSGASPEVGQRLYKLRVPPSSSDVSFTAAAVFWY